MSAANDASDQVGDRARFAAREFVARWSRETGEALSAVVTDRMLFAYEMGYLRGRSDAAQGVSEMFDESLREGSGASLREGSGGIARTREEARKKTDDDSK